MKKTHGAGEKPKRRLFDTRGEARDFVQGERKKKRGKEERERRAFMEHSGEGRCEDTRRDAQKGEKTGKLERRASTEVEREKRRHWT